MEEFLHILKHSTLDSLKVLFFAFIIYVVLSFFEGKITNLLKKNKKIDPILGATAGLIPQCGISVIAADLYIKKHITMGTLIAVFFACSDEALPILLSDGTKAISVIPLLLIKVVVGFLIGFIVDIIIDHKDVTHHLEDEHLDHHELNEDHVGCCHHHIEGDESQLQVHFIHPLIHSLKIFGYVFVVNMIFGGFIHLIGGEQVLVDFLVKNEAYSPLVATLIGIIPNCASSVLITEVYLLEGLPFAGLVAGLSVNSGLGLIYLVKNRKSWKDVLIILGILLVSSILTGYIILGIMKLI